MQFNRRKKIAAATGMSAIAILAVVGGTLAQFTDSDTSVQQVLTAGTVEVDMAEGANWTNNLDNLAIGDTKATKIDLVNNSTLALLSINLTADVADVAGAGGGELSDRVSVTVTQEKGATDVVLVNDIALDTLAAGYLLDLTGTAAGDDVELRFDYVVDGDPFAVLGARDDDTDPVAPGYQSANGDNAYQGSTLTVDYTIDAIQRDGVLQP